MFGVSLTKTVPTETSVKEVRVGNALVVVGGDIQVDAIFFVLM